MNFLWRGWVRLVGRFAAYRRTLPVSRSADVERQLSHLAAHIPGFVHTFRKWPDGRVTVPFASAGIRDVYGVRPEDIAHDLSPLAGLIHPGDRARFYAAIAESARALVPFQLEFRVLNPEKGELWVDARSAPEAGPDGSILWHGVTLDITARKRMEEALHASEEKHRAVFESANDGIFLRRIVERDGNTEFILHDLNHKGCELWGHSREDIRCGNFDLLAMNTSPYSSEEAIRRNRLAAAGQPQIFEWQFKRGDGSNIWGEVNLRRTQIGDEDFLLAVVRDTTERKQAETAIHERLQLEERLSRLTEVVPGALFILRHSQDGRLSMPWAADKLVEIAGCWPEDTREHLSALTTSIHAGDVRAWRQAAADSARTLLPWHSEFRLAHPIRGETWVEWRATPVREPNGSVLWHGFMHDISERKAAEVDLRMAASVFDTAREGILITDTAANILKINPAFTRITGYDLDDVRGKKPSVLSAGRNDKAFYVAMWASLLKNGTWSGDIVNRRKDGEVFTEFLSISAVYGPNGDIGHYVGIFSDITQIKQHEQRLEHMAQHDTLTGLPNRFLLTDRMQQVITQSHRSGEMLAVLFLDLDGFKPINDNHGHDVGDRTLIEMGRRMTKALRASDTVARIGGDEFVILLAGLSSKTECEFSARRVLMAIAEPVEDGENRFLLSASIGIALYPDDADDADSLLRHADEAMYTAKRTGRNQFVFYSDDLREQTKLDGGTVHDLRLALQQGQIEVHYQPIVDFATGRVAKAEALVRWHHPVRGMVPPAEFIPVAEDAGLIHAIGDLVFRKAVHVAGAWNTAHPGCEPRRISVNRSPREFFGHDGVNGWISYLNTQHVPGAMLSLEITEGLLLDDRPMVLSQLKQLRAMGMTIALDDFGTGYSSLSYLKKFDIDYIKIDRSFVRDMVDDPSDLAIVESIIVMAHRLGIKIIAEGVETEAQASLLAAAGCDFAQGYFYAQPMPEREFLDFVSAVEAAPLPAPALLSEP